MDLDDSINISDVEEDYDTDGAMKLNSGREGIIFLIDCRKEMFIKEICTSSDNKTDDYFYSGFVFALECCKETMLNKIRESRNSLISVVFCGVENGDVNRKHILEFQPLAVSSAARIRELDEIISSYSSKVFKNKYGHADSGFISDALSASCYIFSASSLKLGLKRILLFTKDDNPDSAYPDRQYQIRKKAKDLFVDGVDLDIFPPIGTDFNPKLFYQEILQTVKNGDYDIPVKFDDISDALAVIQKECNNKRTLSRIKFYLGDQVAIGVGVYRFTCKQQRIKRSALSRETNEPVQSVIELLDTETGDKLRPYQVVKVTNVGGKNIHFSSDELLKMRKVFEPGMTLLGFKPKDFWNVEFHNCQSFFIFPDESIVEGSRQLFVALRDRCLARKVVAICALTIRSGSCPKYVVLVPQEEVLNENNYLEMPTGFHVYVLPFARLFGDLPIDENYIEPSKEEMEVTRKILKKSKMKKFHLDFFENPAFSKLSNSLEAVALHLDNAREFKDTTIEHHYRIGPRLGDLAEEFSRIFLLGKGASCSRAFKRKIRETSKCDSDVKIPRKSEFIDLATQKKIHKLTVIQLKEILKFVPRIRFTASKKNDLIALVYKNIDLIKNNFS